MLKKMKTTLIATSIIYLIVGITMLIFPENVSDFMCYMVAIMFLFFALAGIVLYMKTEIKTAYTSSALILSILIGAFGLYILLNPRSFISFIPLVIGIFLIADSIGKLSAAFDLKKMNYSSWWHMLIVAFLILGFGFLLVFNPFKAVSLSIMVMGGIMIFNSISNIITLYSYSKAAKDGEKKILDAKIVTVNEKTSE